MPNNSIQQFALAQWLFLDAAVLSAHFHAPPDAPYDTAPVHVSFVDWIPGILSLLGYIVVNLIDKDRIKGEESYADSRAVWRARLFLFIGFALMAGGLAGSVVRTVVTAFPGLLIDWITIFIRCPLVLQCVRSQTVLVLKYFVPRFPDQFVYYGYANVAQNVAVMLSAVVLWIAQSGPNDYEYNLAI